MNRTEWKAGLTGNNEREQGKIDFCQLCLKQKLIARVIGKYVGERKCQNTQ